MTYGEGSIVGIFADLGLMAVLFVGAWALYQLARQIQQTSDRQENYNDTELGALNQLVRKRWPHIKKEFLLQAQEAKMGKTFQEKLEQELIEEYFPTKKE